MEIDKRRHGSTVSVCCQWRERLLTKQPHGVRVSEYGVVAET